jgi:hypothetical protein
MRRRSVFFACVAIVLATGLSPVRAIGQAQGMKELLPGAWTFVSVVAERDDGTKTEPFGRDPKGIIVFTKDGHFSLFQSRAEVPKIASNDRSKATAEEATGIVASAIAYYGTYAVNEADKTLLVKIAGSTYANLVGPPQKRIITSLTEDELRFTNPRTPAGVTLQTVWRRARSQ